MTNQPPGPAPDWAAVRLRYEQAQETVAQIAASIKWTAYQLTQAAKARGWAMRSGSAKSETTRQTLRRLKDIIQNRLRQLESEISKIGDELNTINNEREIRSTNTLVRTLEKVLELEHKERKQRGQRRKDRIRLDDAGREELAGRIAGLCETGPGESAEPQIVGAASAGAVVGLAAVGAGGPASA